jgi:hypothetical protein
MKKLTVLVFSLIFAVLSRISYCQDATPAATVTSSPVSVNSDILPVENFSPDHLKGHYAIGASSINDLSPAMAVRYWFSETKAVDIYFAGYDNNDSQYWAYGLGFGFRQNWKRPVDNVTLQFIEKITFERNPSLDTPDTLNLFLGPGFEAFIPFWKNLSVEASIGANLSYNLDNGNHASFAIAGDNFSVFNAAVHFYFDEK